jgi:queuosine precursor transporter
LKIDRRLTLFLSLTAVFTTSLVVGDLIGGKLIETSLFGTTITLTVGMIPFPVTFLLTDIINEFYGKRAARTVTWVGFGMALFAFALIAIAVWVPIAGFTHEPGWEGVKEESFRNVFSGSQRILAASMVAYLTAQLIDVAVFHFLKRRTQNRFLWLRATGSTAVSQLVDTIVIQIIAWYGLLPASKIFSLAVSSYGVKLLIAIGLTPAVYGGHLVLERFLGIAPVKLDETGEVIEPAA